MELDFAPHIRVRNITSYDMKISVSLVGNKGDGAWFTVGAGGQDQWQRDPDSRGYIVAVTSGAGTSDSYIVRSPNVVTFLPGDGGLVAFDANYRKLIPLKQRFKT